MDGEGGGGMRRGEGRVEKGDGDSIWMVGGPIILNPKP